MLLEILSLLNIEFQDGNGRQTFIAMDLNFDSENPFPIKCGVVDILNNPGVVAVGCMCCRCPSVYTWKFPLSIWNGCFNDLISIMVWRYEGQTGFISSTLASCLEERNHVQGQANWRNLRAEMGGGCRVLAPAGCAEACSVLRPALC